MAVRWNRLCEKNPAYGQICICASVKSSFDGERFFDVAIYKQYDIRYESSWGNVVAKSEEMPHFETLDGSWIDDTEFWMPLPKLD